MQISDVYAQQDRDLHAQYASYGAKALQWEGYIEELMAEGGYASKLQYSDAKLYQEPADLVVCFDLDRMKEDVGLVLAELVNLTVRRLFFDLSLRDGATADGWRERISNFFDIAHWVERPEFNLIYGEAVPKGVAWEKPKRRRMNPEISAFCTMLKRQSEVHSDAMSRIETISMWEGVDDRRADLQIVYDLLDQPDDPAPKVQKAIKLAGKAAIFRVALTEDRPEDYWRKIFEKRCRVANWDVNGTSLVCTATPKVGIAGVKIVGARSADERWDNVKIACERITKRIIPVKEPHGRRAIIACYGPSLKDTIQLLKWQAQDPDTDVFSVSGAHDFLLSHGIVPTYHVECDPRAHKADNIDKPHPGVKYLLGSAVHPALLDKLEGADIALWHIAASDHVSRFIKELKEPGNIIITGGGSVGLRSMNLTYNLGYRRYGIHGMDCSFADGKQWAGKHAGRQQELVKAATVHGETFDTSLVLLSYATDFLELVQRMKDVDIELYGHGLQQSMCEYHAQLGAQNAEYRDDAKLVSGYLHIPEREVDGLILRKNGFFFPETDTQWAILSGQSRQIFDVALEFAKRRNTVVQAGGNVGVLAKMLSAAFDRVITFEPDTENFRCLEANVAADNAEKHNAALGAEPGRASLKRMPENCGSHEMAVGDDFSVATIDSLDLPACDLIILDVEGYEYQALLGAKWTIGTYRPVIILEDKGLSERFGTAKGAAPQWLADVYGYKIARQDKRDVVLVPA